MTNSQAFETDHCDFVPELIMDLLDRLEDGLQWTVVQHKGSEWYLRKNAPPLELELAGIADEWLVHVAEDADTPVYLLDQFLSSDDPAVRIALADNRSTPLDILMVLTEDDSADVRFALAENHNLPQTVLEKLIEDDNPYVAQRAQKTLACLNAAPIKEVCFGTTRRRRKSASG